MFKQHKPQITEAFQALYKLYDLPKPDVADYIDVSLQNVHKWLKPDAYVPRYALFMLSAYIKELDLLPLSHEALAEKEAVSQQTPEEVETDRLIQAKLNDTLKKTKARAYKAKMRQEAHYAKAESTKLSDDSYIVDRTTENLRRL